MRKMTVAQYVEELRISSGFDVEIVMEEPAQDPAAPASAEESPSPAEASAAPGVPPSAPVPGITPALAESLAAQQAAALATIPENTTAAATVAKADGEESAAE